MRPDRSVAAAAYVRREWRFDDTGDADAAAVTDLIRRFALPGRWLDMGCGPLLTVWPMFARTHVAVVGIDREPSIAAFHRRLRERRSRLPVGLRHAVDFFNALSKGHNQSTRTTVAIRNVEAVVIRNLLDENVDWSESFDTILQIGCFGCLNSYSELQRALRLVYRYLRPGARFISTTWIARSTYVESNRWGGR